MRTLGVALAWLLAASVACAHDFKVGALGILHPHARPTAPAQPTGAGYFKLVNGGADDRLVAASVPADIAERVEMHSMSMQGDVMRMREVAGIDVPAGQTVELKPGGLHLMLVGLKAPLAAGQRFPMRLTFRTAGEVSVEVHVEEGAAPAAHAHRH